MSYLEDYPEIARLREVAAQHAPEGWILKPTGIHPCDGDGYKTIASCCSATKTIEHPPITDRATLYMFLHECGHANCGHGEDTDSSWAAIEEFEAEMYAIKALRTANIPIPRHIVARARDYVRKIIEEVFNETDPEDTGYHTDEAAYPDEVLQFAYGKRWRG